MSIEKEKKGVDKLKKDLEVKEEIFELLVIGNYEKADEELRKERNKLAFSYFNRFQHRSEQGNIGKVIRWELSSRSWEIDFDENYLDEIQEDLNRQKKEISEREYILQQKIFLEKQQELIELQKKEIDENKKDRDKMNNFTFVLALGVLATVIYYMFDTFVQFKISPTFHILLGSGIACLGLTLVLIFIISTFDMKEMLTIAWKKSWPWILFLSLLIIIFSIILLTQNDRPATTVPENGISLINQTNLELNKISKSLDQSVINQQDINTKLDVIILNQMELLNKTK